MNTSVRMLHVMLMLACAAAATRMVNAVGAGEAMPSGPANLRTGVVTRSNEVELTVPVDGGRVSWQNVAPLGQRGVTQTQWQVEVNATGSTGTGSAFHWRSMVLSSNAQAARPAALGMPALTPDKDYTWRVWTELTSAGAAALSAWSDPLAFSTVPANTSWATAGASWIGGKNMLRADVTLAATPVRARVYVSGMGAFYLYINGKRVGDHVLDPPQTVYPSRVSFTAFDVLPLITKGHNAVGAILGNYKWGYTDVWCNMTTAGGPDGCRALILQLVVTMADGSVVRHGTNTNDWQVRQGPIVWDHLFHGETYDAALELDGWASAPLPTWSSTSTSTNLKPNSSASASADWQPAVAMHPPPGRANNLLVFFF